MAQWTCERCGIGLIRDRAGDRPIRFCSQACYHSWRKEANVTTGQFKKSHAPWNKGLNGIHLSPDTEFKPGERPINHVPVGTVTIRYRNRSGKERRWIKVAEPNEWQLYAIHLWRQAYGDIPKGLVTHHLDGDTLNDSLANIALVSRTAHLAIHRPELEERRKQRAATPS